MKTKFGRRWPFISVKGNLMKLSDPAKWTLAIGLLLTAVACASTFGIETGVVTDAGSGYLRVGYDGRDLKVDDLPEDGNRADIKFYDANGNEIPNSGAEGVGEGDKVPVPPGATHATISGPSGSSSCTGCTGQGGSGGGGGARGGMAETPDEFADSFAVEADQAGRVSPQGVRAGGASQRMPAPYVEKWAYVYTLDGDFDGSTVFSNVSARFVIRGDYSAEQIQARIAPILIQGPGAVIPLNVVVEQYVRLDAETLGARLFVADKTQSFTTFAMDWNGGSKTPTMYAAPNGWQVAEVFIPMGEINIAWPGTGANNYLDLVWRTHEDAVTNEVHENRTYTTQ